MNDAFLTLVIRQPADPAARGDLLAALRRLVENHGADITGVSLEDEMTVNESLERRLSPDEVEDARREAARLGARALEGA